MNVLAASNSEATLGAPPSAAETAAPAATAAAARALRADALTHGVMLLLGLTVIQRLVGFVRSVLFCRWLPADELGLWDLCFGFLLLAAPLAVLGLPGTFGRYLEYFRQRQQMRTFLARATQVSVVCSLLFVAGMVFLAPQTARLLFDQAGQAPLVIWLAATLLTVIAFNFMVELFTALRQTRVASLLQFVNSMGFAVFGAALLVAWQSTAVAAVVGYGAACVLSVAVGSLYLREVWRALPAESSERGTSGMWAKLLPFAWWIWVTNLLANLFHIVDRYMIIQWSGRPASESAAMVGNYHSSWVIPTLFVAVGGLLAGLLLPYLSHDWERGDRRAVSDKLSALLKLWGIASLAAAWLAVMLGPLLFNTLFAGKYAEGLQVFPWSLACGVWLGICLPAQNYLWCGEKARFPSIAYALGLAVNVGLNVWLLPWLGLLGVVIATSVANALALACVLAMNQRLGMKCDPGLWIVAALPLLLGVAPWLIGPALAMLMLLAWRTEWLFSTNEREQFSTAANDLVRRIRHMGK